ncbi:hypothetical protein SAMN05216316_1082 [Nitrosovibrio sp. Nv6]|nr:hypothetical protein SAMN05216316_1082 [Nitrosovibrio sp. Nv6]
MMFDGFLIFIGLLYLGFSIYQAGCAIRDGLRDRRR